MFLMRTNAEVCESLRDEPTGVSIITLWIQPARRHVRGRLVGVGGPSPGPGPWGTGATKGGATGHLAV